MTTHTSLLPLAALAALLHHTTVAAEIPKSAEAFVDSIGVNVHASGLYAAQHESMAAKLGEAGIRHVRDGARQAAYRHAVEFYEKHGIQTT